MNGYHLAPPRGKSRQGKMIVRCPSPEPWARVSMLAREFAPYCRAERGYPMSPGTLAEFRAALASIDAPRLFWNEEAFQRRDAAPDVGAGQWFGAGQ